MAKSKFSYKNTIILGSLILFVFIIFSTLKPFIFQQKIEVAETYLINIPSSWNYEKFVNDVLKDIVVTNYKGEISVQDRSDSSEYAKVSVSKLSKENIQSRDILADTIKGYYPDSKIAQEEFVLNEKKGTRLNINSVSKNELFSYQEILIVEYDELSLFRIDGYVY
ncbi:hypothetical protein KKH23_00810, partial [Patescibacteria group bacterium]|nr:hypothetical protein [Patescibacteria group bacterium]